MDNYHTVLILIEILQILDTLNNKVNCFKVIQENILSSIKTLKIFQNIPKVKK